MNVLDKTGVGLLWSICKTKFALTGHTHTLSQIKDAGTAASKSVKTASDVTSADWVGPAVNDNIVPTMTFIAYWNGAYDSNGNSNLQYCSKGKFGTIVTKNIGDYAVVNHTHNYAGSKSVGGPAKSALAVEQVAVKSSDYKNWRSLVFSASNSGTEGFTPETTTGNVLITNTLSVQPSSGTIKATKFKGALEGNASTASNASKVNGHTVNADVPSGAKFTDTNTWRGIQNNLTSNSTSDSLSAAQGKVLKGLIDSKANSSDLSSYAQKSQAITSIDISLMGDTKNGYTQSIIPKYANNTLGVEATIKNASFDTDGFMSRKDKSKLDGIQAGANKYTLPVASATTLGGIKVTTNATGTQWPICIGGNGIAYAHINGLSQGYDNSIDSLLVVDDNDHSAKYGYNGIDVGMSDSARHHIDFPSKSGTFALTSDCLSTKKLLSIQIQIMFLILNLQVLSRLFYQINQELTIFLNGINRVLQEMFQICIHVVLWEEH